MSIPPVHLILTVGTNPLPVYVAAFQLIKKFMGDGREIHGLTLIISDETERYKEPFQQKIQKEYPKIKVTAPWRVGNAGNPKEILQTVQGNLATYNNCEIHLHYTGGTKALAVHAWEAVKSLKPVSSSYLDPRNGASGPCIIDNSDHLLVADCRQGIHLDIEQLLGFHAYRLKKTLPDPPPPPPEWGVALFDTLAVHVHWSAYNQWYENVWRKKAPKGYCPAPDPPIPCWPSVCGSVNQMLESKTNPAKFDVDGNFSTTDCNSDETKYAVDKVAELIFGKFLEFAVFYKVQSVLKEIAKDNSKRNIFHLYHSIEPRRDDVEEDYQKNFELDVVGVLGYQLVVISCTTQDKEGIIKLKAMEALHRAQQIGGEEARALVVCGAYLDKEKPQIHVPTKICKELYLDSGRKEEEGLVDVWGWDKWANIQDNFKIYFNSLKWI
jgi:hypothetical protein